MYHCTAVTVPKGMYHCTADHQFDQTRKLRHYLYVVNQFNPNLVFNVTVILSPSYSDCSLINLIGMAHENRVNKHLGLSLSYEHNKCIETNQLTNGKSSCVLAMTFLLFDGRSLLISNIAS